MCEEKIVVAGRHKCRGQPTLATTQFVGYTFSSRIKNRCCLECNVSLKCCIYFVLSARIFVKAKTMSRVVCVGPDIDTFTSALACARDELSLVRDVCLRRRESRRNWIESRVVKLRTRDRPSVRPRQMLLMVWT